MKARIKPASRKNVMTSSAGTTPTNIYERISLRRTRHSSRRFDQTAKRVRPYAIANSSARLPTMSIASSAGGSVIDEAERPGDGLDGEAERPARARERCAAATSATRATATACRRAATQRDVQGRSSGGYQSILFNGTYETPRRRALQHDLHSRRTGARPRDRRHHHADLPDLDLRAGRPRPAHAGFEYGRTQNPTRMALERNVAAIEAGTAAFAFASGMAAIDALLTRLESGDHVLVSDNTYGGTFRLFERVRRKFGLDFTYVDTSKPELIEPAIKPNTKYLFIETPTNPMLHITDIQCASAIAHRKNVRVIVDNTFASPYIQRPLTLGADIVMHSTTKFLNGHSDSVGGIVILKHQDDVDWMKFVQNAAGRDPRADGFVADPARHQDADRSAWSAPTRTRRCMAEYLEAHPKVKRTIYPGLKSHPHHDARAQADARLRRADLVRRRLARRREDRAASACA